MEENKQNPEYEERDATLDDEPTPTLSADEVQDSLLEDSGMNGFQKWCARMDDKRWTLMQRVTGALLGIAAGVALFWDTLMDAQPNQQQGFFSIPLIVAIAIALIVPNIIEKQSLRRIPKLRTAMVIALALMIVVFFVVTGLRSGFKFTN